MLAIDPRRAVRRALGATALALLLATGIATAAQPPGPRLAVVKHLWKPPRFALLTVGPNGGTPVRLAGGQPDGPLDTLLLAPLSWRPDGVEVAFSGLETIVLIQADGSGARSPNVAGAESPVFAPDGHTIAFERGAAVWTIDLLTGEQRRLTPWRHGISYVPSSFSPDGTTLLATRNDDRHPSRAEPVALHLDSGGVTLLLGHGREPIYSPDGSKIALFRGARAGLITDLFVLDVASGTLHRLTHTRHNEELFASWDPSGERIAFTRFRGRHYEWADSIVEINADGSCEKEVLSQRRTLFYGAAWQPGPGREAGPIEC